MSPITLLLRLLIYYYTKIYKENYLFQLFLAGFSFQKCPQFSIQITHVTNR